LLFGILSDMANQNANQLNFSFFFDYTNVQFYYPMLPIISTAPDNFGKQILEATFTLTSNVTVTHANSQFLPEDESEEFTTLRSVLNGVKNGLTSCVSMQSLTNGINESTQALTIN